MLVIDAANVIGSRPTGWWRDRAGAARSFVDQVRSAVTTARLDPPVVVVLEGRAREGAEAGVADGVAVLHADGSGDDKLVDVIAEAAAAPVDGDAAADAAAEHGVTLVSADRELRRRAEALGAEVVGPRWLLERLAP